MKAGTAVIGKKYLSKNGIPVTVVEFKDDKVVLFSEVTKMKIPVSQNYPLKPYEEDVKPVSEELVKGKVSDLLNSIGPGIPRKRVIINPKAETMASVIDPYLFEGGRTVKEIVRLIEKRKLAIIEGKDLHANVRARLVNYTRKGFQIERAADKKVKVTEPMKHIR